MSMTQPAPSANARPDDPNAHSDGGEVLPGVAVVLAGPSGAGKSSIAHRLVEGAPDTFTFSVSATTRSPRTGEQDGVDYFFLTKEQFEQKIAAGDLLEHATYNDNYYGTPRSYVEQQLGARRVILLDIDVQGMQQIIERRGVPCLTIFVMPPSIEVLAQRLRDRQTNTEEDISRRMLIAQREMRLAPMFDAIVVNHDLAEATAEVAALIDGARRHAATDMQS